jgi:hypothetical protein
MQLKILARWYQMIKGAFGKFASFTLAKRGQPCQERRADLALSAWHGKSLTALAPRQTAREPTVTFLTRLGKVSCRKASQQPKHLQLMKHHNLLTSTHPYTSTN